MDKFFYRLTVQTVIKAVLTAAIAVLCTGVLYTIFISVLQPISAKFDYWLQAILMLLITMVTSFTLITLRDNHTVSDTYTYAVGRFWSDRAYKKKPVRWFFAEIMMLPLLALAFVAAYLFCDGHAAIFEEYTALYAAGDVSASAAQDLFITRIPHFLMLSLAWFFIAQWKNVREFAKDGRCPKCKSAFALDFHRDGGTETTYSSKITKKGKTKVVGESYQITVEDGEEVDRTKISDVYGKVYDRYQTDTKTSYRTSVCHCGFCGEISQKTDVWSTSTTKKLP